MKKLLIVLLVLPFIGIAQDCKLKKSTDPFTHVVKISTGFVPFDNNNLKVSLSVDATPTDIDFFFWITGDSRCFDDKSTGVINFDGDRLKTRIRNNGSMNCDGAFHLNFRNLVSTPSALDRIASKKIKSIELEGSNNVKTVIELTEQQKQMLMLMASCIIKESKSLIKQ